MCHRQSLVLTASSFISHEVPQDSLLPAAPVYNRKGAGTIVQTPAVLQYSIAIYS